MNSDMCIVIVEMEVGIEYDIYHNLEFIPVVVDEGIPLNIRQWIERDSYSWLDLTEEEEKMHWERVERQLGFEVEVWYKDTSEGKRATDATCHTVCPQFVKAWMEKEAMKQFNKEHESCMNSSIISS